MAKVKFPLELRDGVKVRNIEEFKEYFDMEKVLEYFYSGKLQRWLEVHYYDELLNEIISLDQEKEDFSKKLAAIFDVKENGVDSQRKIEIQEREILREKIKPYVSENILEELDLIADTQKRFEILVEKGEKKIYLFKDKEIFTINSSYRDLKIIGINCPVIAIEAKSSEQFADQRIIFVDVEFADEETKKKVNDNVYIHNLRQIVRVLQMFNGFVKEDKR